VTLHNILKSVPTKNSEEPILFTLNCSLKKPVENKKEEVKVGPGETVLFKDRAKQFELYTQNKTQSGVTFYIEAIGDVWGYVDPQTEYLNIGDSLSYDTAVVYFKSETSGDMDYGFDHLATETTEGHYFCYSIYKVGTLERGDHMRISWIDDRYYYDTPHYDRYDTWAIWDNGLKIGYETGRGFIEQWSANKTYMIWKHLKNDTTTSVDDFEGNLSKITGGTISGPDSLGTDQSGNFTATRSPGGRELQFIDYKWEVKKGNESYSTLENWSLLDSTTSYSANMDFTLKAYFWDLVYDDTTITDTHLVKVNPTEISGVDLDGPQSLDRDEEGEFTADVTPSYRAEYNWYIDYDWSVMYLDEPPKKKKKKEERLRLPPTNEWLDLDQWDGYPTIDFSSGYL